MQSPPVTRVPACLPGSRAYPKETPQQEGAGLGRGRVPSAHFCKLESGVCGPARGLNDRRAASAWGGGGAGGGVPCPPAAGHRAGTQRGQRRSWEAALILELAMGLPTFCSKFCVFARFGFVTCSWPGRRKTGGPCVRTEWEQSARGPRLTGLCSVRTLPQRGAAPRIPLASGLGGRLRPGSGRGGSFRGRCCTKVPN